MRKLFILIPALSLMIIFACAEKVDIEVNVDAIQKLEEGFDRTAATGDVEGNLSAVANDAVYMQPNGPIITGKDAIRAFMISSFDQFNFESKHSPETINVVGNWAIVHGNCKGSVTPKLGGDAILFNNKYLHIYRIQSDGTWKLARSIWNSNDPFPVEENL